MRVTLKTPYGDISGARYLVNGTIGSGADWHEDVVLIDPSTGSVITSADSWTWHLTLREDKEDTSAILTLTTADSTLAISQGASSTTLQIRGTADSLSALEGDYVCDIASNDGSRVIHWGHGLVTINPDPPAWST